MILLAALLAIQGFSDVGSAPDARIDISTLEGKLGKWKGRWGYNDDKFVCETTQSSGDSAVDSVGCSALISCLGPEGPRLNAIAQGAGNDKDRAEEIQAAVRKSAPCVADKRHSGLMALAELRGFKGRDAPEAELHAMPDTMPDTMPKARPEPGQGAKEDAR